MDAPGHFSLALQEPNQIAGHAPWSMDFRQISAGSGRTNVRVRSGRSLTALALTMEARVHQMGEAPPGVITLGVPKPGTVSTWLGVEMIGQAMILFGSGQEFDGVSEAGFEGVTVSLPHAFLDGLAEDFGLDPPETLRSRGVLDLTALPKAAGMFVGKSVRFLERRHDHSVADQEDEIGLSLLLASASKRVMEGRASSRLRDRALPRALGIIDASLDDPPSIRALCAQSDASWPTLHRAFVERFGVGPKAYLTRLRLTRARTDLLAAPRGTRVSDVANQWGFWHMGEFAGIYRKLFSRLPSQDLRSVD
ncbi:MAG: helix-turn-helix domain-containing protein [Pseudomonadota bacterium]